MTEQWCYENKGLQDWEIAELLESIMDTEFNVRIEDGSPIEIGRKILEYLDICSNNDEETIRSKMLSLPRCDLSKSKLLGGEEDMEINDIDECCFDNLEIDEKNEKNKEPVIDEDGFQMVTRSMSKKK